MIKRLPKRILLPSACVLIVLLLVAVFTVLRDPAEEIGDCRTVDVAARMRPDYAGVTVPPNICPLRFVVAEKGVKYCVRIAGEDGTPVEVFSRTPGIVVPASGWRELLAANVGRALTTTVFVKDADAGWRRYPDFTINVAEDPIDRYLVYREMPTYNIIWKDMGLYERDLEGYAVRPVLQNRNFGFGCCNCHTFSDGTKHVAMNVRGGPGHLRGGLLIAQDGKIGRVVDTRTAFNPIPAVYLSWHPSGKAVVFSTNSINQSFHASGEERHSFDRLSDLGVYLVEKNLVSTDLKVAAATCLEDSPCFSHDGSVVYYVSAGVENDEKEQRKIRADARKAGKPIERHKPYFKDEKYRERRYDLMRVSYDVEKNAWGEPELLLSCDPQRAATGKARGRITIPEALKSIQHSIAKPIPSPDGNWLLFCVCDFGNFPVYQETSDLYLLDLRTNEARSLGEGVNSPHAESWHAWSSNSRWIVFSSKRPDGLVARPHFAHVDADGNVSKPFVLPQKDPAFYDGYIRTFNVPVLIPEPVPFSQRQALRALHDGSRLFKADLDPEAKQVDSTTGATALEHAKH